MTAALDALEAKTMAFDDDGNAFEWTPDMSGSEGALLIEITPASAEPYARFTRFELYGETLLSVCVDGLRALASRESDKGRRATFAGGERRTGPTDGTRRGEVLDVLVQVVWSREVRLLSVAVCLAA